MSEEHPNFDLLEDDVKILNKETPLTPEQEATKIYNEILTKFGASPEVLTIEQTKALLATLKQDIELSPTELSIQEQAKKVYQEYIKEKINPDGLEKNNLLNDMTESIDSNRLLDTKDLIEPLLDETFNKYDFLDGTSKNLLKISIINKLLESGPGNIIESYIGGFHTFISGLQNKSPEELQKFFASFKKEGEDSGRTNALVEMFQNTMSEYTQTFDDIEKKFTTEKITDPTQKQNILSHVEWFRNPTMMETGVQSLIVEQIDVTKTEKNGEINMNNISEYLMNSREKLVELSKKMNLGDRSSDMMYTIMQDGLVGDAAKDFTKMLLKIPILGKILAVFLGLNPNTASEELEQNASLFKNFSTLKGLGTKVDKENKTIEGKAPFEKINLGKIHFNHIKNEVKEIQNITGNIEEKNLPDFWKTAFTNGYEKNGITLKFDLGKKSSQTELSGREMRDILKDGLKAYNDIKEEKENKAKEEKRREEKTLITKEISTLESQQKTIEFLLRKDTDSVLKNNFSGVFGDYTQYSRITMREISEEQNIEELLKKYIGEDDFLNINDNNKKILSQSIEIIREYLSDTSLEKNDYTTDFNISTLGTQESFQNFLNEKLKVSENNLKEKSKKLTKINQENLTRENLMNTTGNLSTGVDISGIGLVKFDTKKQQLSLGEKKFQVSLEHKGKNEKLSEIALESDKVAFRSDGGLLLAAAKARNPELGLVAKETTINGLMEMINTGSFTYKKGDIKLSFTKLS